MHTAYRRYASRTCSSNHVETDGCGKESESLVVASSAYAGTTGRYSLPALAIFFAQQQIASGFVIKYVVIVW
jgi:hypothetical protein